MQSPTEDLWVGLHSTIRRSLYRSQVFFVSRRCQVRTANYPKPTGPCGLHSVFHQAEECECDGALEGKQRVRVCGGGGAPRQLV